MPAPGARGCRPKACTGARSARPKADTPFPIRALSASWLTSLPKMVRTAFCLPIVDPQPKGALHAFGCVWEWSSHAHEAFSWVCA